MGEVVTFPGAAELAANSSSGIDELPPDRLRRLFLHLAVELHRSGYTGADIYNGLVGSIARLCYLPGDDATQLERRLLTICDDLRRTMESLRTDPCRP